LRSLRKEKSRSKEKKGSSSSRQSSEAGRGPKVWSRRHKGLKSDRQERAERRKKIRRGRLVRMKREAEPYSKKKTGGGRWKGEKKKYI